MNKCHWCGGEELNPLIRRIDGLNVAICKDCGLRQLENVPDGLSDLYDNTYFSKQKDSGCPIDSKIGYASYHETLLHVFLWQYAFLKLSAGSSKGELLDVGCASGKFLELAGIANFSALGLDISQEAVQIANIKGLSAHVGTIKQLNANKESFEVVTAWDLIEHVTDLRDFLNETNRILKNGGVFIFSTPDAGAKIAEEKKELWNGYTTSLEHISFFTFDFLKHALKEIFDVDPQMYSFTYGEYSTIIGYIRKGGQNNHDKVLDLYFNELNRSKQIEIDIETRYLLALIYIHFGPQFNNEETIFALVESISSKYEKCLLRLLRYLEANNYQDAIELVQKVSKNCPRDSLIWQIFIDALQKKGFGLENQIDALQKKAFELENQIDDKIVEIKHLKNVIYQRDNSLSWRLSQFYGKYFDSDSWFSRILSSSIKKFVKNNTEADLYSVNMTYLINFLEKNKNKNICLFFSGTKFVENEGQRSIRLAQGFSKEGYAVIFASWRWNQQELFENGEVYPNIYQVPIDILIDHSTEVLEFGYINSTKLLIIEFPHPLAFELLSLANSANWITIYDIIDHWGAFNEVGQAAWYDQEFEAYVLLNTNIKTVVSPYLCNEVHKNFGICDLVTIPNAVDPAVLQENLANNLSNRTEGKLIIGYFGHLTSAWFDWDLLIKVALRHPEWVFQIIGYGEPKNLDYPTNISLLGKISPTELSYYCSNWNVAIIPFKNSVVSSSADPIKIYEYIYFNLPVVVTGIVHVDSYPHVWVSHSVDEFEANIKAAAECMVDKDINNQFIKMNTWGERVRQFIDLVKNLQNTERGLLK